MSIERTYTKRGDQVYLREVDNREDVNGKVFTVFDKETEFDHKKHLPQLAKQLTELQEEIADFQVEEARLITQIISIKAARDSR